MPFGIGGEASLHLGKLLVGVGRPPWRGIDRHDRVHEVGVGDRPLKGLIAAIGGTGDGHQVPDAERIEERLLCRDDVAQRDRREIGAVRLTRRGIVARRVGRTIGRAQHVARHHEQPIGVDRLARPNEAIPRARQIAVRRVAPGGVVPAGIAVRDQHRVAPVCGKRAVGLVGDRRRGHHRAVGKGEIADREKPVLDRADVLGAQRGCIGHVGLLRLGSAAGSARRQADCARRRRRCHERPGRACHCVAPLAMT